MKMSTSKSIMKSALLIAFCIISTNAMTTSSKNFLNSGEKVASVLNETDTSEVDKNTSMFRSFDIDSGSRENVPILVRKATQADTSDALNKEIDNLRSHITTLSDNLQKAPTTGGGTFNRPSSSSKFTMLENEIKKMKEDIQRMKGSSSITDTSKAGLNALQDAIETLEKLVDNKNRQFTIQIGNITSFVDDLTSTVANFRTELRQIKERIDESERSANQRTLPAEIIEDVKSRNFVSAYQKIPNLQDINKINYIVHEIYNNNAGNFDLLLQFGDSIRNIETSFRVYKAINYEMEYNNHDDPLKLIKLIEKLETEVIKQKQTSHALQEEAEALENKIKNVLKGVLVRKMKDALSNKNYQSVFELCNRIHSSQYRLFNEAIKQVTKESIDSIDASELVKNFDNHTYIGQSIYGFAAVFNELNERSRTNDKTIINIAFGLKNLMQMPNYPNINLQAKIMAENLRDSLPTSLKNLAFSSRVCIKNIARNEYLYAAGDAYKADGERRRVFTWVDGSQVTQGVWVAEPEGDIYLIKNLAHNEYLYAANYKHVYDESRRSVYTWVPGSKVTQGRWTFELNGDNVHLRNAIHGEFLFADSERKYDDGRRHVFTWINYGVKTPDSLWEVEDCKS